MESNLIINTTSIEQYIPWVILKFFTSNILRRVCGPPKWSNLSNFAGFWPMLHQYTNPPQKLYQMSQNVFDLFSHPTLPLQETRVFGSIKWISWTKNQDFANFLLCLVPNLKINPKKLSKRIKWIFLKMLKIMEAHKMNIP